MTYFLFISQSWMMWMSAPQELFTMEANVKNEGQKQISGD